MKTIKYKGYHAAVEFEKDSLFVRVLHINDVLIAQCNSATEVQRTFEELIDEYLADCAELNREPGKPFKGTFNVRITPELHRRAAMAATSEDCSLNAWVGSAISEKLDCDRLSDRMDRVFSSARQKEDAALRLLLTSMTSSTRHGNVISTLSTHGELTAFRSAISSRPRESLDLRGSTTDKASPWRALSGHTEAQQ